MERGERIVADPRIVGEGYRARFRQYQETLKRGCMEKNIDYQMMLMSEPFDRALITYLARRK
jgi:hypothetical protein